MSRTLFFFALILAFCFAGSQEENTLGVLANLAERLDRLRNKAESAKWYQQAPMLRGQSWSLHDFVVDGHFQTKRTAVSAYNDSVAPGAGEFYMVVKPSDNYWYIRFRTLTANGTWGAWGKQLANATGGWAISPGKPWSVLTGINFTVQAAFQHGALDTSTDKCRKVYQGLIPDITSCGCALASSVTLFDATSFECRRKQYHHAEYNATGSEPAGIFLEKWEFQQRLATILVGGPFVVDHYSYDVPVEQELINVGEVVGDYCTTARPASCGPMPLSLL